MIDTIAPRYWTSRLARRLIGGMTVLERGHPARWLTIALAVSLAARQRKFEGAIVLKSEPVRDTAPGKRVVINPQPQLATFPMAQLVRSVT